MKRYAFPIILGVLSVVPVIALTNPRGFISYINSLDDYAAILLLILAVAMPTIVLGYIVYKFTAKAVRFRHPDAVVLSVIVGLLSVCITWFGIPFALQQILDRNVRTLLATDFAATQRIDLPADTVLQHIRLGFYGDRCDWACRQMLIGDVLGHYIATNPNNDMTVTYAFQTGGTCLGDDAFTLGRQTPGNFDNARIEGKCIIAVDTPARVDLVARETDLGGDQHIFGSQTVLTTTQDGQNVYQRTKANPNDPFPFLGLITDRSSQGGAPLSAGVTRFLGQEQVGIDQLLMDAIEITTGREVKNIY